MLGRGRYSQHFRVGGWILKAFGTIITPSNNKAVVHNYTTHRHFVILKCLAGLVKRLGHEPLIEIDGI